MGQLMLVKFLVLRTRRNGMEGKVIGEKRHTTGPLKGEVWVATPKREVTRMLQC